MSLLPDMHPRPVCSAIAVLLLLSACGGGEDAPIDDDGSTLSTNASNERESALNTISWSRLASEGRAFSVSGTRVVRYGSGSQWTERSVSGNGQCTNSFFGRDPAPNVAKVCDLQTVSSTPAPSPAPAPATTATAWTKVANEGGSFIVSGVRQVRYGAGSQWVEKSVASNGQCTNSFFGRDPAPGVSKTCEAQSQTTSPSPSPSPSPATSSESWSRIASEGRTFSFSGTRQVRYGAGSQWVQRSVSSSGQCTNSFFGRDPAPGTAKACDVLSETTAAPSPSAAAPAPSTAPGTRNALQQPFASNSIWNMPIGSGARFAAANMIASYPDVWASMPFADEDVIILKPTAPLTDVRKGSWGGNRCSPTSSEVIARVPIPSGYVVPNSSANLASAVLMPDGRTLASMQPLTRCSAGGVATSTVRARDTDLYGDGIDGAHGGSRMSSIGGTLRLGEMRPGQQGPRHALKLIVNMREVHRCTTYAACYRWPAKGADSYAVGHYGTTRSGPAALKMGSLLAVPSSVNIGSLGLESEPGRQLAWTLQNYGGYIVDDAYGGQFGIATELGPDGSFVRQFASDYGFAFHQRLNANGAAGAWMRDVQRLVRALNVVDNNSSSSIGGGGTPRQPLAPALR
jgi:hypothetical protein